MGDLKDATMIMMTVLDQGGLAPGGLNFDCKARRESTCVDDMLISHIGAMDCFAKALRVASRIKSGFGADVQNGVATLEDCEKFITAEGNPKSSSGQQEKYETILNRYLF